MNWFIVWAVAVLFIAAITFKSEPLKLCLDLVNNIFNLIIMCVFWYWYFTHLAKVEYIWHWMWN